MTQNETNQAEWRNPDNWGGPDWMAVYFSKKDSRAWVPKRIPWMGWTLNLAQRSGVWWWWLLGFVVGMPALFVVVAVIVTACGG